MASIGTIEGILLLRDQFTATLQRAQTQIAAAGARMEVAGRRMSTIGGDLTRSLTLPLTIVGGLAVKSFADFDDAMTKSLAIMDDTAQAMRGEMTEAAREVARTTTFSATQAAESYFFLASAGLDAKQSIAALPVVAKFAQAGAFDMALATDLLTDAQSALGLTIRDDVVANMENMVRVSDVLVKANTLANATVEQFSTSLTREAGAALKSFNIDVEEGVAVLAAFADQGVKGELAGTALSRILRLMTAGFEENRAAFERYNVEVFDAQGNINNLADIIQDLEIALGDMSDETRVAALEQLGFQARVQGVLMPLLGTSEAIRNYEDLLRDAGDTTERVATKQLESFKAQMTLVKNRIMDAFMTLGEALIPAIQTLTREALIPAIDKLAAFAEWFKALPDPIRNTAAAAIALTAALGPMLFLVGNLVRGLGLLLGAGGFSAVATGVTALATAIKAKLATALVFLATPMGAIIAALGALAAGIHLVTQRIERAHALMLDQVGSVNDLGEAINDLRVEVNEAEKAHRELNLEIVERGIRAHEKLEQQLKKARAHLEDLRKKSGEASKEFKQQAAHVRDLESKFKAADKLIMRVADDYIRLRERTNGVSQSFDRLGNQTNRLTDAKKRLWREAETTEEYFQRLFAMTVQLINGWPVWTRGVREATEQTERFAWSLDSAARAMSVQLVNGFPVIMRDMQRLAATTRESGEAFDEWQQAFANAIADMVLDAGNLGDAIEALFRGRLRESFVRFFDQLLKDFDGTMKKVKEGATKTAGAWEQAGKDLGGTLNSITAAFYAATGDWEDVATAAMASIVAFAQGNFVGGVIAAVGAVIGAFKNLKGETKSLEQQLTEWMDVLRSGNATIGDLSNAVAVLEQVVAAVAAGGADASHMFDLLRDNFNDFIDAAVEMGDAGVRSIDRLVHAIRMAGIELDVLDDRIRETIDEALELLAERAAFLVEQSGVIIESMTALFTEFGAVSRREVEFAATSVMQAFAAMIEAGLPLSEIAARLGDVFDLIGERAEALGIDLPEPFRRLGEVIDILGRERLERLIGRLDAVAAAAEAAGNMGLLTAEQFDVLGDRLQRTFRTLVRQGLTSEEALAALAPQLQILNDLTEQYGFELDANTQRLLDQAIAQGVVTEKSLTAEDIMIAGFNAMLEALNRLIEALGGVPVQFDNWLDSVTETTEETNRLIDEMGDNAVDTADQVADGWVFAADSAVDAWMHTAEQIPPRIQRMAVDMARHLQRIPVSFVVDGSFGPGGRIPHFQHGSGRFMDFGAGTLAVLHGREQVLTDEQGASLAALVATALGSRGRRDPQLDEIRVELEALSVALQRQQTILAVTARDAAVKML